MPHKGQNKPLEQVALVRLSQGQEGANCAPLNKINALKSAHISKIRYVDIDHCIVPVVKKYGLFTRLNYSLVKPKDSTLLDVTVRTDTSQSKKKVLTF